MDSHSARLHDIREFYSLLAELEHRAGGMRRLSSCTGRMAWPQRGVYFFFESGEERSDSGSGPRMVRVGTHALAEGSATRLWQRLSQHRGSLRSGGGNHRGSIFRLLVGKAMEADAPTLVPESWGRGSSADTDTRAREHDHERRVSQYIGAMQLLWIDIPDGPGALSLRGVVERNAIGLLSNYGRDPIDWPSPQWLGHSSGRTKVRESGLWNQNHVDEGYNPSFLSVLAELIAVGGGLG